MSGTEPSQGILEWERLYPGAGSCPPPPPNVKGWQAHVSGSIFGIFEVSVASARSLVAQGGTHCGFRVCGVGISL